MARLLALVAVVSFSTASGYAEPLVAAAHREKVAAAALIGVGSAIAVAGQILLIVAAVDKDFYGADAHCGSAGCAPRPALYEPFAIPGAALVGVGAAALITGIPLYVIGGREMRRAAPTVSFAPRFSRDGGGLVARVRF